MLENANVPRKVKRTLLFHNVLILELKNKYKKNKRDKQKHILSESMPGKILKKYRFLLKSKFNFSRKRQNIRDFYVREDNIILTADIMTRFKI